MEWCRQERNATIRTILMMMAVRMLVSMRFFLMRDAREGTKSERASLLPTAVIHVCVQVVAPHAPRCSAPHRSQNLFQNQSQHLSPNLSPNPLLSAATVSANSTKTTSLPIADSTAQRIAPAQSRSTNAQQKSRHFFSSMQRTPSAAPQQIASWFARAARILPVALPSINQTIQASYLLWTTPSKPADARVPPRSVFSAPTTPQSARTGSAS